MDLLRELGINLLGTRNRATGELIIEIPALLVTDAFGYSH